MIIQDFIDILDQWAPKAYAEDFDNIGLLVGDSSRSCTGALISLDCTEEVVQEAIGNRCNLIICFHPIIFSGLKKITGQNYVERVVIEALENKIAIFALHTRLDNHPKGVNYSIERQLGLINTRVLIPKKESLKKLNTYVPKEHLEPVLEALHQAGAGKLGKYSECSFTSEGIGRFKGDQSSHPHIGKALEKSSTEEVAIQVIFESHLSHGIQKALINTHPYETVAFELFSLDNSNPEIGMGRIGELPNSQKDHEFLAFVKKQLKTELIRHSSLLGKTIRKVAVLGGSGSFAIEDAKVQGADAFITADLKYHQFYQAENQLILIDVGHYESEQFTKKLIFEYLIEKIPNFAIILSIKKTNPVNYF